MAFQTSVPLVQGFGVPGDIHLESPFRAEPLIVNSSGAANTYGFAFTKDAATNVAKVGGTIAVGTVFAGLLVNSKEATTYGTTAGTLEPTLNLPDNMTGMFCPMGDIVVKVSTACKVGDVLVYDTTTGALSTMAPGATAGAGKAAVPNAVIYRYPVTNVGGGLTVARLTN